MNRCINLLKSCRRLSVPLENAEEIPFQPREKFTLLPQLMKLKQTQERGESISRNSDFNFEEYGKPLDVRLTDFGVNFSDGTSISLSMDKARYNYTLGENIRTYRNVFSQPIDPEDIVSVTAFGETIPIK